MTSSDHPDRALPSTPAPPTPTRSTPTPLGVARRARSDGERAANERVAGRLRVVGAAGLAALLIAGCSASRADRAPATVAPLAAATAAPPSSAVDPVTAGTLAAAGTPPVASPASADVQSPAATASPADVPATLVPPAVVTTPAPAVVGSQETLPRVPSTIPPIGEEQWAAVDRWLESELVGRGDFAVSYAVSIDGQPVHAAAFGVRNHPDIVPETTSTTTDPNAPAPDPADVTTLPPSSTVAPEPVTPATRFRIASISKVITGTVVLQLVEDGTLGLDQPVGGLLGQAVGVDVTGRPFESVTVRQLLSHTSGFGTYQETFFRGRAGSCREAAAIGATNGLQHNPGTTYHYSNMNYCMLQILIETVTGRDYQEVVYERLLTPLGITGMRLAGTFDPHPDEAIHPSFPGRKYMEALGGAGAWVATPADLVKIIDALDNSLPGFKPLSPAMTELMRQPIPGIEYSNIAERWYGMSLIVFATQEWGHSGTIENTHAMVMHRPDGMTWALLISGNHPDDTNRMVGMFQAALDASGVPAPAPTTTTTTTLPPPTMVIDPMAAATTPPG